VPLLFKDRRTPGIPGPVGNEHGVGRKIVAGASIDRFEGGFIASPSCNIPLIPTHSIGKLEFGTLPEGEYRSLSDEHVGEGET
jgi:hypothetical protein